MDEKPLIEFPCDDYPIKVIGTSDENFAASVAAIVLRHDESFAQSSLETAPSSKGNYLSVRLTIRATGERQLKALHQELMAHPNVKLVL